MTFSQYNKRGLTKYLAYLASVGTLLSIGIICHPATGQIIPDRSLGNENSEVSNNLNLNGLPAELIEGGAQRDSNLFHSFSQFNIEAGRGAYFANPENVTNIFSRVTGGSASEIMGQLGVLGNANLFLLNPNGIIFGENASLNLNGSFFATTAESLLFESGFEFSATAPETPPLLTINQPLGLNLGNNPGKITNNAITEDLGLQVSPGENISLIGGEIELNQGKITAPGGKVRLGGLASSGFVGIDETDNLNFSQLDPKANVSLSNGATVDVRADEGGTIEIKANNIQITEASNLAAGIRADSGTPVAQAENITLKATDRITLNQGSIIENQVNENSIGNGGDITIESTSLTVNNGSIISTDILGQGDGGQISIQVSDSLEVFGSAIFSDVNLSATGNSGNIQLDADSITISEGSLVSSRILGFENFGVENIEGFDEGRGNAGEINITANSFNLSNNSLLDTSNLGLAGNAGKINIRAENNFLVDNSLIFSLLGSPDPGSSNGGIEIDAASISLVNLAELNSSLTSGGKGNAGNVRLNAGERVILDNGFIRSRLEKGAEGKGGDILIDTGSLLLTGIDPEIAEARVGQITAATFGNGDSGNVIINAREDVSLSGVGSDIFSLVAADLGIGDAGDIIINTQSLSIEDQARLVATTEALGNGGNIIVNASDSFSVSNQGQVNTDSTGNVFDIEVESSRDSGNIEINTNSFVATDEAVLNAGSSGTGNAGNITINAKESALLQNNSDISVRTLSEGNGGSIGINTNRLEVNNSLIDTSTFGTGNAGEIEINATELLEVRGFGLSRLETEIINPALEDPSLIQSIFSLDNFSNINSSTVQGILAFTSSQGKAGGIKINTPSFSVADGSLIATSSIFEGDAGSIVINTSDLLKIDGANISSSSIGRGNGGDIEINTGKLTIDNGGQIDVSTLQSGDGGNLTIRARDSVELRGIFNDKQATPSSILVGAQRKETTGNGGNLQLSTSNLTLKDGALINAGNFGRGDGGNIQLEISDLLLLRNNSNISTTAGSSDAGGNGGNIDIQAEFLVAFPTENSDIDANAFQGQGGRINIATQGVFGIEVREKQSNFSDITAFSQENPQLDGEIVIETEDTNLDRQFNRLPEDFVDFSSLIVAACPKNSFSAKSATSEFIVTGRGGIPPTPEDNFRLSAIASENALAESANNFFPAQPIHEIIEANHWTRDQEGRIFLIAIPNSLPFPNHLSDVTSCNS